MDGYTEYTVTVRVPDDEVEAFEVAKTGRDDDVILAAEGAMRARVEARRGEVDSGIEIDTF